MSVLHPAAPLALTLLLWSGSASSQTPPPANDPPPGAITGSTTRANKGLPNGRSDSEAPYANLVGVSQAPDYGRVPENPIRVGVGTGDLSLGPRLQARYLNALRGPQGQPIEYERRGSCCFFQTPHGPGGRGLLDVFDVKIDGVEGSITLYLNLYDPGAPLAPQGFTPRPR